MSETYCYEWWFLQLYILILIIYPYILSIVNKYDYKYVVIISYIIQIIGMILTKISYSFDRILLVHWITMLLGCQFLFILGMVVEKESIFDKLNKKLKVHNTIYLFITILLILLLIVVIDIPVLGELIKLIIIPIIIFTLLNLINEENKIYKIIVMIGNHSTNIWLTHTLIGIYLIN